jgi:hypothetical protein
MLTLTVQSMTGSVASAAGRSIVAAPLSHAPGRSAGTSLKKPGARDIFMLGLRTALLTRPVQFTRPHVASAVASPAPARVRAQQRTGRHWLGGRHVF